VGLSIGLLLVGCSSSGTDASKPAASSLPTTTSTAVVRGARVYASRCAGCHGVDRRGNLGPSLVGIGARHTPPEIAAIIRSGRGIMPSFESLTDAEVAAVVQNLTSDPGPSAATP
jgi:mono/diheme cytochrome c family protein